MKISFIKISLAPATLLFCIALAPLPAAAGQQEDQSACMNDAMTICSQFIPDRERVASCLISNSTRVSEACRLALTHFDQSRSPPAAAVAAERPAGPPVNSISLNSRATSRTKLATTNQLASPVTAKRAVGAPINLVTVNSPTAPRAKSAKGNPVASQAKSATIR
jgi:hypothetical protein